MSWLRAHRRTTRQRWQLAKILGECWSAESLQQPRARHPELGMRHLKTRPSTLKTNGKSRRFVQTSLCEWASVRPYVSAGHGEAALQPFLHGYKLASATLCSQPSAAHEPHPAVSKLLELVSEGSAAP